MKHLNQIIATLAIVSVTIFWISLFAVTFTNGRMAPAAELCAYSMVASFFSLLFYFPKTRIGTFVQG